MAWQLLAPVCGPGHGSQPLTVPPFATQAVIQVNAPDSKYELFVMPSWNTVVWWDETTKTSDQVLVFFQTFAPPEGGILNWFIMGSC